MWSILGRIVDRLEEAIIALIFGVMVLVTFVQVVLRYVFNSGFVWALELTTYLFAWLVLFGISYGVKKNAHLGVDAFVRLFSPGPRRVMGLLAVAAGVLYGVLLLIGAYNYVFAFLFRIGIESEDLPIPQWLPMAILPIGLALLIIRFVQVGIRIATGRQEGLVLGDEAREAIETLGHDEQPAAGAPKERAS
jgi:C4-dicarboxylate transporter DctQ subunit